MSLRFTLQWRHNERDGVTVHRHLYCLLNRSFRCRSKKTPKLRLCEGNSSVIGEFHAQRASNAENVSIWWRHHDIVRDGDPARTFTVIFSQNQSSEPVFNIWIRVMGPRLMAWYSNTCSSSCSKTREALPKTSPSDFPPSLSNKVTLIWRKYEIYLYVPFFLRDTTSRNNEAICWISNYCLNQSRLVLLHKTQTQNTKKSKHKQSLSIKCPCMGGLGYEWPQGS